MWSFVCFFFFFKQKTAYEIVSRDWSSDVCSSDLTEITKSKPKIILGKSKYKKQEVFAEVSEANWKEVAVRYWGNLYTGSFV